MIYPDGTGITWEEYQRMENNAGWRLNTKENRVNFKDYVVMFADGQGVLCYAELDNNGDVTDKIRYEIPDQISLDRLIDEGIVATLNPIKLGFKLIRKLDHDHTREHGRNCHNFPFHKPERKRQKCWKCNISVISVNYPTMLHELRRTSMSYDYAV